MNFAVCTFWKLNSTKFSILQIWFHVKYQWQKNPEISTLWTLVNSMVKLMPITSLFVIHTMIYFSSVTSRSKDLLLETLFSHSSSKGQIISPTLHQHLLHWSAAVNTSPSYLKYSFCVIHQSDFTWNQFWGSSKIEIFCLEALKFDFYEFLQFQRLKF